MKLTPGLEDYIEEIYIAHLNNIPLKAAELARKLKVSRASVSEALTKLVIQKLINYNRYEVIRLTDLGVNAGKEVYDKHHTIAVFFENILGIDKKEASENACKIEHIISKSILEKMRCFINYYKNNESIIKKIQKGEVINEDN